jgi:NAD(P)-dependent dehydrogenase (short-subunit alcohol dehydrogenase family)
MSNDAFGLAGKVCVVTGGGSGIGRGIALALSGEGAVVAVLDRNLAAAQETLSLIADSGGKGLVVACDVSDRGSVEAARDVVRGRFGDPHVLVNNAGMVRPGPLASLSTEDWNALLAVNLTGYLFCAQVFGSAMRDRGDGVLVHIASHRAEFPGVMAGAYSVTKAGVQMLSRQLAAEWGPSGVRSNCVLPGFVLTPLSKALYDQPGVMDARTAAIPSRRIGTPEDTAQAVLFLASPRSSYINGTEILVDGGLKTNLLALIPRGSRHPEPGRP